MKKTAILVISILLLILSSCRNTVPGSGADKAASLTDEAYERGYSAEIHNDFNHFGSLVDKMDGQTYFIRYMLSLNRDRMMYLDTEQMEAFPLCGKAECPHKDGDPNCNANLPGFVTGMAACSDTLLFCVMGSNDGSDGGSTFDVYRMNADGTKRQKIRALTSVDPTVDPDYPSGNNRLMFHRGHVYAVGDKRILTDGKWSFFHTIIDYDLSNDEKGKVLYESPLNASTSRGFKVLPVGSSLYYARTDLLQEDDESRAQLEIGEIDVETGQISEVYSGESDFCLFEFYTDGSRFVFTTQTDGRVMEYDRETGQIRKLMDFRTEKEPFSCLSIADNRVIGFSFPEENQIHILVRDFEGQIIYNVTRERADFEYGGRAFCGIDEHYMYCDFSYGGDEEGAKECLTVYPLDSEAYYVVWQDWQNRP